MSGFKRHESLRCLFASVASVTVMDWLLDSGRLSQMTAEAEDIDDMLVNIRSFFVTGMGWSRKEVRDSFIPIGSPLSHHIYGVLFADAIRWWAAAHRTGQDENKHLRDSMYKDEFSVLRGFAQKSFFNTDVSCKKFFNSAILGPALRGDTLGPLPRPSAISLYDGWMFRPFTGLAEEKRRAEEGSPVVSRPAPALVCPRGPRPVLSLHLGQVGGQVVDEPADPGAEALGFGRLGVPHDAQAVLVGIEAHDLVIAHPELLPASREVQVLGGEAQDAGIGLHGLLPLDSPAAELAGAVIESLRHPDADSLG